jgi:hypothetical protein
MRFTILDDGGATEVDARVDGARVLISSEDLERSTGWSLKPQGLCRGDVCIPVPPSAKVADGNSVDVAAFADVLARPLAVDVDARAAALGDSAIERARLMHGCLAPDFTLPDLSGRMHSLGDYRGRKALLIAWASW